MRPLTSQSRVVFGSDFKESISAGRCLAVMGALSLVGCDADALWLLIDGCPLLVKGANRTFGHARAGLGAPVGLSRDWTQV